MTDLTRAEIEALVNLRQFSGETRVKTNRAITQLLAKLDAAENERDVFRAVLDGQGVRHIDVLATQSVDHGRALGVAIQEATLASIALLDVIAPQLSQGIVGGAGSVEVCFECDIADCYHIRARRAAPPDVAQAARMRQALELCPPDRPQMSGDEFRAAIKAWWKLYARPALDPTASPTRRSGDNSSRTNSAPPL